jgi:alkylhydroperoxidase family enzyme
MSTSASRIPPLEPPYASEVQQAFDVVMRGAPPLELFRTVAHNPRVLQRLMAGGLLDKGSITLRQRELMILRTTARCGAEYEWGVHVAAFGQKAGWTPAETAASLEPGIASIWQPDEALILRLADELHETQAISDALWTDLAAVFEPAQRIELIMLAGLYHAVSYLINGLRIEHEASAPRFPRT